MITNVAIHRIILITFEKISSKPTPFIILSLKDWEIKATGLLIKTILTPELNVIPGKIRINDVMNNPKMM